jgi:hypothetical protein
MLFYSHSIPNLKGENRERNHIIANKKGSGRDNMFLAMELVDLCIILFHSIRKISFRYCFILFKK